MNNDNKPPIKIGHIGGNFIYSNNQSGGITGNVNNSNNDNPNKKPFYKKTGFIITVFASIVTILTYFGIKPYIKSDTNQIYHTKVIAKSDTQILKSKIPANSTPNNLQIKQSNNSIHFTKRKKKMSQNDNKHEPFSIGKVARDVVISNNQTGGITAHTVIVGNPKPEPRHLNQEDRNRLNIIAADNNVMIWRSMNNVECINYSDEIVNYLKSIGRNNIQISLYGQMIGLQSPRFDLSQNGNDFTVSVSLQ